MDFSDTDSPAYWDIADISAIYGGISKIFKILVNSHVLPEPTDFYKDRSMYGEMASKIRGHGSLFLLSPDFRPLWIYGLICKGGQHRRNPPRLLAQMCGSMKVIFRGYSRACSLSWPKKLEDKFQLVSELGAAKKVPDYWEQRVYPLSSEVWLLDMWQRVTEWQAKIVSFIGRPQKCSKYDHEIPISWTIVLIFKSAGSLGCPLSDEVW